MTFEKGNKFAQEWTLENATPRFTDALKFAETSEECLCLQDAILQTGIPVSTFYYLADNHDVLETIKREIHAHIICRINKNALTGMNPAPASPSIWRMKQLGEKDQQYIESENTNRNTTKIVAASKEDIKVIEDLQKKFNDE